VNYPQLTQGASWTEFVPERIEPLSPQALIWVVPALSFAGIIS